MVNDKNILSPTQHAHEVKKLERTKLFMEISNIGYDSTKKVLNNAVPTQRLKSMEKMTNLESSLHVAGWGASFFIQHHVSTLVAFAEEDDFHCKIISGFVS